MGLWELLLVALALAMDALAVSIGLGLSTKSSLWRCAGRAAAAFGLFQAGMTLAGWAAGRALVGWTADWVEEVSHYVAAGALVAVALHMLIGSLRRAAPAGAVPSEQAAPCDASDASRGWRLLVLAVATSLDALGAGLGLGMVGVWQNVWIAAAVIGLVAAGLSAAGVVLAGRIARSVSGTVSRAAEAAGALVLLAVAAKIALGG